MFHHRKWDDQLLFICSTLRTCKKLVRIDGRQILWLQIIRKKYHLYYFYWWSSSVASINCIGKTNWCLKTKLHMSLLQVRKDRQVINCNAPFIHNLHHFFIGGSHIPSHQLNRSNIIDLIQTFDLIQTVIVIMYHIGLTPSTVMRNRSNQQMLMPYIPILSTILTSLQSTIIMALSRYNMVNRNHSAHHYHLIQLIGYRLYSISYRSYSCTIEYFHDYVICSFTGSSRVKII
jgi:hypothetical protein